jgi:hypothetical protein
VYFEAPSDRLRGLFALSVGAMLVHKAECWFAREWLESPFFAWLGEIATHRGGTPEDVLGGAMFAVFVFWLFVGLAMVLLVLRGGAGPLVALGLWGLTFLLELHHVVRALEARGYYPGIVTALPYIAIGPFYWREWARHVTRSDVEAPV